MNLVTFAHELLTGDIFNDLLYYGWIFNPNAKDPKVGSLY